MHHAIASALAEDFARRAKPIGVTFATWPLTDIAHRRDLAATTLTGAVKLATPPVVPAAIAKGGFPAFVILETDDRVREGAARQRLHFYIVKVKREHRAIGPGGSPALAAVPYAVHSGTLAVDAFSPRRPFDALRDCAATGLQPGDDRLIDAVR